MTSLVLSKSLDLDWATQQAIRTDLPTYNPVMSRLTNQAVLEMLRLLINRMISVGQDLNRLKKHLFYGQDIGLPATLPVVELDVLYRTYSCARLLHGAIGLATESGEIMEALQSFIFNGENKLLDKVNVAEECGDITWYLRLMADELGPDHTLVKIIATNIEKLRTRYPEKFTEDAALNRDLSAERKVLEAEGNTK